MKSIAKSTVAAVALLAGAGLPALAQTVEITTTDEDLEDSLSDASLLRSLEDNETEAPAPSDFVSAARADYRRMLTALYNDGYYGGTVSILIDGREASGIEPLDAPSSIGRIQVLVDPGPRFTFGRAVIEPVAPETEVDEGFAPGEPARSGVVRSAVSDVIGGWRDYGHAKADVADQQVTANHAADQLNVDVAIAPGPLLTFGPLVVSGNRRVRTERIIAIAGLPTGERFDPEEIDLATERLRRTGAFSAVSLEEAEEIGPNQTLPIEGLFVEDKLRRVGFGIEVSSVEGLTLSTFWLHRNLLGGAERFRIDGEINGIGAETDEIDYEVDLSFNKPAIWGPDVDLYANLGFGAIQDPAFDLLLAEGEIGLTRIVTPDLTVSGGVGFRAAEVTIDSQTSDYFLLTLPLSAEFDRRNNELNPESGYYIDAELTPFYGVEGSESGARLYSDARYYRSFGNDDRFTLAGRLQFGSVVGPTGADAPADYLFYSGGGGTVRGQEFQSLGVTIDGTDFGGNAFLGAQAEARIGVTDRIEAVAFYDYGQIGEESLPASGDPSHAGVGLGIRYDTGIGPIRLDLATPASGDDAYNSVAVYIGIGQSF
ncbi:autotransporter assembly complex protein TamA [Pelagovum pacificum]|uniref:autotransporter assembly complex protein TamA n=1 Tax=Pelagovum pacificum TaxID=2588711 RepID=UPI001E3FD80A|nr:autotransporter assembly complex family protein [Pelagovum pacificum]